MSPWLRAAAAAGVTLSVVGAAVAAVIGISAAQSMQFGRFVAGSGGSVTVSPLGARTAAGGVVLAGGTYGASVFTVTGDPGAAYSVSLPVNGMVVLTGPGADMPINNFTSSPASSGILDGSGQQTLYVGATLGVNANQASGSYSGTFDVTVNYQ